MFGNNYCSPTHSPYNNMVEIFDWVIAFECAGRFWKRILIIIFDKCIRVSYVYETKFDGERWGCSPRWLCGCADGLVWVMWGIKLILCWLDRTQDGFLGASVKCLRTRMYLFCYFFVTEILGSLYETTISQSSPQFVLKSKRLFLSLSFKFQHVLLQKSASTFYIRFSPFIIEHRIEWNALNMLLMKFQNWCFFFSTKKFDKVKRPFKEIHYNARIVSWFQFKLKQQNYLEFFQGLLSRR